MNTDKNLKGHMAALLANLMWGLMAPFGKIVLTDPQFSAFSLTTFRVVGAAVCFWIFSLFIHREKVGRRDLLRLFFASVFGIVFNQGLSIFGLSYTSPIHMSIINTMPPIFTMIIAALFLREPITGKKLAGVITGAVGALILVLSGSMSSMDTGSVLGDVLILMAGISFSLYLTLFKDLMVKYSPITISKWMFTFAVFMLVPMSWSDVTSIVWSEVPVNIYLNIAFVVFGGTFIAYIAVQTAQKLLRPTVVSMYNYVQPIVASVIAVALGMDTFGIPKVIAVVLVFLGVWTVTQSKSRSELQPRSKK